MVARGWRWPRGRCPGQEVAKRRWPRRGGGGSSVGRGSPGQAETGRPLRRCQETGTHSTACPACCPACRPACPSSAWPGEHGSELGWWTPALGPAWARAGSLPGGGEEPLGAGSEALGSRHRGRGPGSSRVQQSVLALMRGKPLRPAVPANRPSPLRCGLSPALRLREVGELSCSRELFLARSL